MTVFVLSALIFVADAAKARNGFEATNAIEIASLFYKMTGQTPGFSTWASYSDKVEKAPEFDKQAVQAQEETRLREIFYNVFTDEMLNVQIRVDNRNYSDLQQKLFLPEVNEDTYFSYSIFGQYYALIVPDIARFNALDMPQDLAEKIQDMGGSYSRAELTLKPVRAEKSAPIPIDGKDYWVILCEIAGFRLWDNDRERLFWSDYKDWYKPDNDLLELYRR